MMVISDFEQKRLGTTFLPEDTESLGKAVEDYLAMGDGEIEDIERNIKLFSKKYLWSRIVDAYITYYRQGKDQLSCSGLC